MKKSFVISLSLVIVVGVIFFLVTTFKTHERFDTTKKSHYTLTFHTEFNKDNIYGIQNSIDFSAKLDFRVFKKDKNFIYAGFELSNIQLHMQNYALQKQITALYELFFLVKMDKNGKFLEYYFPRSDDDIKGLLMLFSMIQSIDLDEASYTTEEFDYNGVYEAKYTRNENQLHKSRRAYRNVNEEGINIIFKKSDINIMFDNESNYLQSLQGQETLISQEGNRTLLENTNSIEIKKDDSQCDDTLKIWNETRDVNDIIASFALEAQKYEPFWITQEKESKRNFIKANHITFSKIIDKVAQERSIENLQMLESYLALYPSEVEKLYDIIVSADDEASMKLIHVLKKLNNKEAQSTLIKFIDNTQNEFSQNNRLRAIIAIGAMNNVSEEHIDTLWRYSQNVMSPDLVERSETIILALGNIASHSDKNIANNINQRLKDTLVSESDASKHISLYAMQNSGVEHFETEILELLQTSSSTKLQVSAMKVLQDVQSAEVEVALYEKMKVEKNDYIRAAAIESLSFFEPKENVLKDIQQNLVTQESSHTKTAMVKYLVKTIDQYPQNSVYLEAALEGEHNRDVVKLIIKTIRKNNEKK